MRRRTASAACAAFLAAAAAAQTPAVVAPALRGPVTSLCAHAGMVLGCSQAGVAHLDTACPALLWAPDFRVLAIACDARDGSLLAAGGIPGEAGIVARWHDGQERARARIATELVAALAIDPRDGTPFVGCDDGRVLELDAATLTVRAELRRHTAPVRALALSPAPRALRHASAGLDGIVMLGGLPRSGADADPTLRLRDHVAGVEDLAWSLDGEILASASLDGRVRFHAASGRLLASTAALRTRVLAVTALDLHRFACGDELGVLRTLSPDAIEDPSPRATEEGAVHALLALRDVDGSVLRLVVGAARGAFSLPHD